MIYKERDFHYPHNLKEVPFWKKSSEERIAILAKDKAADRTKLLFDTQSGNGLLSGYIYETRKAALAVDAHPNEEDLKEAKEQVESQERERERTVREIQEAERLMVPYRNFERPDYNLILNVNTALGAPADQLFHYLGIPEERLYEVYEFGEVIESTQDGPEIGIGFTGNFMPNGKQRLADILGKTIEFYYQPGSEPILDPKTKEVFQPEPVAK